MLIDINTIFQIISMHFKLIILNLQHSIDYVRKSDTFKGNQFEIKLISVGDTKVGKSCIIKRYCEGRFVQKYITTIGVDYGVKKVTVSGRKVAVNFFDLSGSSDY